MSKRIRAKHKIDRRLGVNLWGRAKSPYETRQSRPGQHGNRHNKLSDYGVQLMAKQKLKGYYGSISENTFNRYFKEASRRRGDTGENLIGLLESRLDTVIYRMKFVPTMFAARQFVNHGHILVNGSRINIPSYLLKVGDIIEVRNKSREIPMVLEAIKSSERDIPSYFSMDDEYKGTFSVIPLLSDTPYPVQMEPNLVVEFYSR